MARPSKQTVDYFPHVTTHKKTIFIMETTFGNDGYACWFKVLEILGSSEGHFYDYSDEENWLFLVAKIGVSGEKTLEMLKKLSDLNAIDRELFTKKIIWSENFVNGLRGVYEKRRTILPSKPSFLPDNPSQIELSPQIEEKTPQSKVEYSKVEESKEKKDITQTKKYGIFSNVILTDEEYQKLKLKFNSACDGKINELSEYLASKGKKYKNHYATILVWERLEKKKSPKQDNNMPIGMK